MWLNNFALIFLASFTIDAATIDLPPCPEDVTCPAPENDEINLPDDKYADFNTVSQYLSQYDCSKTQPLQKRIFGCFGTLPKALDAETKKTIIEHGLVLQYDQTFLNGASDDRLKLINKEFNEFNSQFKKISSASEREVFQQYYGGIHHKFIDNDVATTQYKSIQARAEVKRQIGQKLSQIVGGQVSEVPFFIVPEKDLNEMNQKSSSLAQQPFPRLLFFNFFDQPGKVYMNNLVNDALNFVQLALDKLHGGDNCRLLPCSTQSAAVSQMFQNVLHHPKWAIFKSSVAFKDSYALTTVGLKDKGLIGLFSRVFFKRPYEYQIKTLIHETTHLYGAQDIKYGLMNCINLLKTNPNDAMKNADSIAWQIIELGRTNCNIQPQTQNPYLNE